MKKLFTLLAVFFIVNAFATTTVLFMHQQSNCRGHASNYSTDTSLTMPLIGTKIWNGTNFATLQVGVNCQYPAADTTHGSVLSIAKQWHIQNPNDTLYIIQYSIISTPLANNNTLNCWFPTKRGTLFDVSISTDNAALSYLWNNLGLRGIYDFIFVLQGGETDSGTLAYTNAYQTNLTNFINGYLTNLNGTAFLASKKSFIITQLSSNQTSLNSTNAGTINTAESTVAGLRTDTYILGTNTQTVNSDHLHFDSPGQKLEGENIMSLIIANGL